MNGWRAQARLIWFMSGKKPNNVKTALILASIALIFFIGVFVKRLWFS
jgi:hypothetical protein